MFSSSSSWSYLNVTPLYDYKQTPHQSLLQYVTWSLYGLIDLYLLVYLICSLNFFNYAYQVDVIMLERNVERCNMFRVWIIHGIGEKETRAVILDIYNFVRHPSNAYITNTYDFDQSICIARQTKHKYQQHFKNMLIISWDLLKLAFPQ